MRSNWNRRPYPLPMPRRWLDFLYAHPWLTLVLMVAGGVFWHRRTQRAAHALPDGPSLDAPVHARNE